MLRPTERMQKPRNASVKFILLFPKEKCLKGYIRLLKGEVENTHLHSHPVVYCTCHAARETLLSGFLPVGLAHPAAQLAFHASSRDGNSVPLLLGHNYSFAFHPSHILWVCARQPTEEGNKKREQKSEVNAEKN